MKKDETSILEDIENALNTAGAPEVNELGCRRLTVLERVEAVLIEWKELRQKIERVS